MFNRFWTFFVLVESPSGSRMPYIVSCICAVQHYRKNKRAKRSRSGSRRSRSPSPSRGRGRMSRSPSLDHKTAKFKMGLGSVLAKHKKPKASKPKEPVVIEPKKKPPAPAAAGKPNNSSSYKGSPLKVTIKNDVPVPIPVEVVESPERKVLSVPSRSGKEPFQNLIIKKDLKQDSKQASPSPVKKPQPALAQTKTIPPLPLPPLIDDDDMHTPPPMKEEDRPRPSMSDLPLPPLAESHSSRHKQGSKKSRGEAKSESVALQKKALILKRRAEITANMPNWGDRCVDKYEIITQIGEGTYGQVYKAKNKATGELVYKILLKLRLQGYENAESKGAICSCSVVDSSMQR